ncbi:MAG: hypothetical protein K2J11_02830 [Oscillospiraceae bacterium]|nr:hypothetical protein [Oscillospiraceae bacterium]
MNKQLNFILKIIVFSVIIYVEQYIFYKTVLCNMITKRSAEMWTAFILGAFAIAVFNWSIEHILIKNKKLKPDIAAVVSSVSICLCTVILSLRHDGELLRETDYLHETSYTVLFILSVFVSVLTIVFNLLSRLAVKFKKN